MVLRKPFAFFIKHFKFIHLILTLCAIFVAFKTSNILNFYKEYIDIMSTVKSTSFSLDLFNGILAFSVIVILLGSSLIAIIMKLKKKPITFYILNIIIYILVALLLLFSYNIAVILQNEAIDIRTLKIIQDLLVISILFQIISVIALGIRTLGFDIKKFEFERDIENLEITSEDNEEIEINLEFDFDALKRNTKKRIRHFKYVYFENKNILNIVGVLILVALAVFIYVRVGVYDRVYKENQPFNITNFQLKVKDTYEVNTDYKGNVLSDETAFIIAKINLKSFYQSGIKFESARLSLKVGEHLFYHTKNYKEDFSDLGNIYTNQKLKDNEKDYLFVFEIPKDYKNNKMQLKYYDYNDKEVTININPNNFSNEKLYNYKLGDIIKFDDSILGKTTLEITEIDVKKYFKSNYKFCTNSQCIDSYEYLLPTYTDNYDKSLLKLTGTLNWDENAKIDGIDNLSDFTNIYGEIAYTINGNEKIMNINMKQVKPNRKSTKGVYYLEVKRELEQADKIDIIYNIRDKVYKYNVK